MPVLQTRNFREFLLVYIFALRSLSTIIQPLNVQLSSKYFQFG